MEGAFNNVLIDVLVQRLADFGCSIKLIKFVKFITQERYIYTEQGEKNFRVVNKGVPQGAVLSPLLYSLYVTPIIQGLPEELFVSQFADDLALAIKTEPDCDNLTVLEDSIRVLDSNLSDLGLNITPLKSQFLHFNRKKIPLGKKKSSLKTNI